MTVEKAIELLSDVGDINRCCAEDAEALDLAIKALEQEPCEDCVGREAVKEQFEEVVHNNGSATEFLVRLWKLPSVQPTRTTGKWETFVEDYNKCSKCGEMGKFYRIYKYCPNCGSYNGGRG